MKAGQVVYKKFLTKKKLSSFGWTHWGFALIVTIGLGILFTFIELVKMHDRRVVFFNIRTVNTEYSKTEPIKNEAVLTNNSPVFVFLKDNVLFGSLKSIIAPQPNNDVLILGENWKEDFLEKISFYKNKRLIFPTKVFGIVFERSLTYEKHAEILQQAFEVITLENQILGKTPLKKSYPAIVFLDAIKFP
ncbi:hypothetical protein [Fluviispira vulneris]|uniref:hypothetical protein n=1 Tax=Fluviispira vulneris TaxID=2763012 RepID=UPI001645A614|nr:hypothetical protein [Fluviispira vulneris]